MIGPQVFSRYLPFFWGAKRGMVLTAVLRNLQLEALCDSQGVGPCSMARIFCCRRCRSYEAHQLQTAPDHNIHT